MEQRREPRIQTDQEVRVTVLNGSSQTTMQGRAVDLSGRGLRLLLPMDVPADSALRIELDDRTLLGEVAYCSGGPVQWKVGVEVQQSLVHTQELKNLNRSIFGDFYGAGSPVDGAESQRPHSVTDGLLQADVTMRVTPNGNRKTGAEEDRQPAAHAVSAEG